MPGRRKNEIMKKLFLGMSGGVDSSVAAYLCKKEGYDVHGVTHTVCGDGAAASGAAKICRIIGIPHTEIDLRDEFRREVMEYFVSSYERGETPNPCVMCNRRIKFPYIFREAGEDGLVATGHYAKIGKYGSRYAVRRGADPKKDQSYVLWALTQEMLSRIVFPLGEMMKDEVREVAREAALPCAVSKESQDICFIPDGDYRAFIERFRERPIPRGRFISKDGAILGECEGQICYTPGQGSGLGIALGHKVFVVSKDPRENTVTLGEREDTYKKEVKASGIVFQATDGLDAPERLTAKIRYGKSAAPATVEQTGEDEITATFDEPVFAPAAGQSLVVYDGDVIVCGGVIK